MKQDTLAPWKARRFPAAGVHLVWLIWPKQRRVDMWRIVFDKPGRSLGVGDALVGLDVVPGFSHPIAVLFLPMPGATP